MNNEIKEILDRLDYNEWDVALYKVPITWCELYDIRDYITNLQQEKDDLYLDNAMLKMEKDIYKTGYEELKGLLSSLQNGSDEDEK